MLTTIRQRLNREESGFTLIELLVVLIIIGVLLAIAIPSYLGFRDRAERRAAASNVRGAVPAVEAFYSDNNTYQGMTLTALRNEDASIGLTQEPSNLSGSDYCIVAQEGNWTAWKRGPAGAIRVVEGPPTNAAVCTAAGGQEP